MSLRQKKHTITALIFTGAALGVLGACAESKFLVIVGMGLLLASLGLLYRWRRCPHCGQWLGRDGLPNFCPNCGKKLTRTGNNPNSDGGEEAS